MAGIEEQISKLVKALAKEVNLGNKRAEQFYNALYTGTGLPIFAQVGLIDTSGDHELYLKCNENLAADRILNLVVGDVARTITLSGNPTLGDWFDQSVKIATSPTFAGVDLGTAMPATTSRMRAYLSTTQLNLVHNTPTLVLFDTENYDPGADFNTGTHLYTVPVTGYYLVSARLIFSTNVANTQCRAAIYVAGAPVSHAYNQLAYTGWNGVNIVDILYLTAGQTVGIYAYQNSGGNLVDIQATSAASFFSLHLLSV